MDLDPELIAALENVNKNLIQRDGSGQLSGMLPDSGEISQETIEKYILKGYKYAEEMDKQMNIEQIKQVVIELEYCRGQISKMQDDLNKLGDIVKNIISYLNC